MTWATSDRRSDLPEDWKQRREEADRRNPRRVCHWCGQPGGEELDHKDGNRHNHAQDNLDWIHGWRSRKSGLVPVNCHAQKTARDVPPVNRPKDIHPCLQD